MALDSDTTVLIVSDHGAKRMDGGICFNQWLIEQGYLTLKETPTTVTKFDPGNVDWAETKAWGDGGYYGRLFLNVEGREPNGTIPPHEVESFKQELIAKLEALGDEAGNSIGTKVFRPEEVYQQVRNVAPDLIVYFGGLHWRSVGSVGQPSVWTRENDTGPDDANHAEQGIFLMAEAGDFQKGLYSTPGGGTRLEGLSIYDIAPTVLKAFGVAPPQGMGRQAISTNDDADNVYSEEEEEELARRLEDLGYL
jgi:predicted AlkP superfamily phosphohydrolase/phosphomutase